MNHERPVTNAGHELTATQRGHLEQMRRANPDYEYSLVDGKLCVAFKFEPRDARRRGPSGPNRKPAKIALLLAFAHRIEAEVRSGKLKSHAEAAQRFRISKSRLSRIVHLTFIAPDIQDEILGMEAIGGIEPPVSERFLRPLTAIASWAEQRIWWGMRSNGCPSGAYSGTRKS